MKFNISKPFKWFLSLNWKVKIFITTGVIVLCAIIYSLTGLIGSKSKKVTDHLYGVEIGNNQLRYKHREQIYNPQTGEVLVDSIEWLHINHNDTIGILAKNNRRAYINLNTAELITPLTYEKAWAFSCDRGIMVKNDSIYIFRRDGSVVNPVGFKYKRQYEMQFHNDKLIVNCNDHVGLIDTSAQWILEPKYDFIENEYQHKLYNTRIGEKCIVYTHQLDTALIGSYKRIDVDWSEGLIATEHNGIQHLFSYEGELIYEVVYKAIRDLSYNTGRKDSHGNEIWEETNCYIYVDYNDKVGLMDKRYNVLTPPLFHDITAQTKHTFFATFGEWSNRFGTLIDEHGKAIK